MEELARRRLGLFVAVARPWRLEGALRELGIVPRAAITLADHAIPRVRDLARAARFEVDARLPTARCAVKLPASIGGAPVLVLDHRLDIGPLCAPLSSA